MIDHHHFFSFSFSVLFLNISVYHRLNTLVNADYCTYLFYYKTKSILPERNLQGGSHESLAIMQTTNSEKEKENKGYHIIIMSFEQMRKPIPR